LRIIFPIVTQRNLSARWAGGRNRFAVSKTLAFAESNHQMPSSKSELYDQLATQLSSLLAGERDLIANAANFSSLVFHSLPDLNWAGFYFAKKSELVLGPFQGRPACVRIRIGQGVCGAGAAKRETMIVPNVHEFPGHIACDSASNSEIVVPLFKDAQLLGVLDLDSPTPARFDREDAAGLETLVRILLASVTL
jgi:L-methionine (R)-S-oxide reductase